MSETSTIVKKKVPRKKKMNQLPIGLGVLALMIVIGLLLANFSSDTVAMFWLFGGCFGFILQKARFCFTAALRDPCITGSTSITKAVLIAFAVATIGMTAIKYGYSANGLPIPGQSYIMPIGLATAVGGILFGFGAVIGGG
ncbi:MAG TPA: YeeE/YedE thiosulfate transporter family protein, partial [Clostridia bacterium]|nr:YeeE/YedE thiosulfate transporter family protein [Clostridia bacterium]